MKYRFKNSAIDEAMESELKECLEAMKKEAMAALLLHGDDKFLYGVTKRTLAQHVSMGTNQ